jgi:hypothetical protein
VILVVTAFLFAWFALMSVRLATNATDVPRYQSFAQAMRNGKVPYRDFRVEYPPAALIAFGVPGIVSTSARGYRISFEVLMGLCGGMLVAATAIVAAQLRSRPVPAAAFVAGALLALGPIVIGHYDLWPSLLVVATLGLLLAGLLDAACVALGVAIAAKLYPLVLLPLLAAWIWRRDGRPAAVRAVLVAAGVAVVVFVPFLILAPEGVWWSITEQATRPLQVESTGAALLLVAHQVLATPLGLSFSHMSANLSGTKAEIVAAVTVLAEAAALLWIWLTFSRGRNSGLRLVRASSAAILAFVTLGKVFSPQFLIWLVPVVALAGGTLAVVGCVAVAVAILLTRAYFPSGWHDLLVFAAGPAWLVFARDLLLLCLLGVTMWALVPRREPAVE